MTFHLFSLSPAYLIFVLGATLGYILGSGKSTVFWLLFYRKGK